jgi:alkylation response protein AidB-like acyl-CoA dehydrogenase
MKLHFDEATERFREELRQWLQANLPDDADREREPWRSSADLRGWARQWQRRLFDAGWLVPGWPPELGGRNATPVQQLVYFEEMARLPVWRSYNIQGLTIIAPSIHDFGSDLQRETYVLPTLRAEISWCLGMSEPGAGSDLAGLSTRAERDGDRFIVNGQKVWTSGAEHADFCFCFVRTDPDAPKHKGISVLIIDMKTPGIDVRPMADMVDKEHADFSEVFFDGVEVPAENLVGERNRGWAISAGSLAHERGMLWTTQVSDLENRIERLQELGRSPGPDGPLGNDPVFRDELAALYIDAQALKFMGYRGFAKFAHGEASPEHSLLKLFGSEVTQRITLMGMEAQGANALDVDMAPYGIRRYNRFPWTIQYLHTFANTIAGGTSEIQRNIIAQRVLGLPRS